MYKPDQKATSVRHICFSNWII